MIAENNAVGLIGIVSVVLVVLGFVAAMQIKAIIAKMKDKKAQEGKEDVRHDNSE